MHGVMFGAAKRCLKSWYSLFIVLGLAVLVATVSGCGNSSTGGDRSDAPVSGQGIVELHLAPFAVMGSEKAVIGEEPDGGTFQLEVDFYAVNGDDVDSEATHSFACHVSGYVAEDIEIVGVPAPAKYRMVGVIFPIGNPNDVAASFESRISVVKDAVTGESVAPTPTPEPSPSPSPQTDVSLRFHYPHPTLDLPGRVQGFELTGYGADGTVLFTPPVVAELDSNHNLDFSQVSPDVVSVRLLYKRSSTSYSGVVIKSVNIAPGATCVINSPTYVVPDEGTGYTWIFRKLDVLASQDIIAVDQTATLRALASMYDTDTSAVCLQDLTGECVWSITPDGILEQQPEIGVVKGVDVGQAVCAAEYMINGNQAVRASTIIKVE